MMVIYKSPIEARENTGEKDATDLEESRKYVTIRDVKSGRDRTVAIGSDWLAVRQTPGVAAAWRRFQISWRVEFSIPINLVQAAEIFSRFFGWRFI